MAIAKSRRASAPIATFYLQHRRMSYAVMILFQIMSGLVVGGALVLTELLAANEPMLWCIALAVTSINIIIGCIALHVMLEPTRVITEALSYVANEHIVQTPPNPSDKQFRHNGTRLLLDHIYQFASAQDVDAKDSTKHATTAQLEAALLHTQSSIILLNDDGAVTYASPNAPVRRSDESAPELDLMFDSGDVTLKFWLAQRKKDHIATDKLWTRVRTNPDSAGDPHIYDIAASYTRGETVLVLQDRTSNYEPDEKDLDFIAFAAHELRGPITVIRGYLEVLNDELDETLSDEQKILMERLVVSSNRLSTYVNNILNVSRYDKKHYRVELTRQNIATIYQLIQHDMQLRAESLNRHITVNIPDNLPDVAADPNSISEVFSNLVDNAIKYSSEGGTVTLSARRNGDFVEVAVQDNGIGMPDSVVQNLFHKFYRSHRSREQVAGSGIGLYLTKAIIESHGGTIAVDSSENKGSTFTFSLPIYSTIEQKLKKGDNGNNENIINNKSNWISNHNMYRG